MGHHRYGSGCRVLSAKCWFVVLGAQFWFVVLGSGLAAAQPAAQPPSPAALGAPGGEERVLVIPFENPAREPRVYWVSEASAVLLADDLDALGKHAHSREERL